MRPERGDAAGWPVWGGDAGGTRYSPLDEITPDNVAGLVQVWTFHTGDVSDGRTLQRKSTFQATPILVADALVLCSPFNRVFAVDAETGEQRWVYDPGVDLKQTRTFTCRGVARWSDPERDLGSTCATRIFTGTVDARLIALDARTGLPCAEFGAAGQVDLREGLGEHPPEDYGVTSPPTVVGDVVAVGAMVADNRRDDVPGGVVRGFDARTGALRWAFDPVPPDAAPSRPGSPRYRPGTPNAWGVLSADAERDLLFVPTGNPANDFFGGARDGIDHYGSSVVALRGSTGEVVWHFQTVHHDLWDYDVSAQPSLIDVSAGGARVPAVAQATKMGHLFLLHRETGVPLFPVEERPVPASDVPGERSSPTQPIPTFPPPLHPHALPPEDAFGLTPWDRGRCREILSRHRNEGIFTPPSVRGSIQFPGVAGGTNWGGVAWDPERELLVLNQSLVPNLQRLVPRAEADAVVSDPPFSILFPQKGTPFAALQGVPISPLGVPCNPTPWGTLLAVDLRSGAKRWEVPFGTTRGNAPFPFWVAWGMPSMGGPIATASGVVFIGAALDGFLRAYHVETGEELWKTPLPAGGQATPMTYRVRDGARQMVVIAAGGHGTLGTPLGDSLVAYALP